ncbi:MAG: LeuA family protein [Candidatus Aenigmatarchaeota archaeon]
MHRLMEDNNTDFMKKERIPEKVHIWDETLRGGEQSPGVIFDLEDKMELAELMDKAGISVIDAGFPMMSQKERDAIEALVSCGLDAEVGATVRCKKEDIDAAIDLGVKNLYMFSTTSKFHLHYKQDMTEEECFEEVLEAVDHVNERGVNFDFISEDTTRSDLDFVIELLTEVRDRGADRLIICDTASSITPEAMYSFTSKIIDEVGGKGWGVHCHNDFGLAVANTVAAVQAGVNYPTVTVNSLGDSSGNPALEEIVMIIEKLFDTDTGVDTTLLYELSKMVERKSGLYLSPQKPISGYNSYRHESEVHVSGVLSHTESYEPISPEEVGREREFVLGKHSGPTNVKELLDSKDVSLTDDQIEEVLERIEEEKTIHRQRRIDEFLEKKDEYNKEMLGFSEDRFWELVSEVKGEG